MYKILSKQQVDLSVAKGVRKARETEASAPIVAASLLEYHTIAVELGEVEADSLQ